MNKFFWFLRALVYKIFFLKIGFFSYIGKPIFIHNVKKIRIGKRVRIFPGLRMEVHLDKAFIEIEDNCSIGQNFHIISGGSLIIGQNTTISSNVFITNIDHDYKQIGVHILKQDMLVQNTKIGENCFLGYGVVVQAGTTLGKQCVVGSNSVVRGFFPDYCVIVGAPAKIVKRYDDKSKSWRKTNKEGDFINEI